MSVISLLIYMFLNLLLLTIVLNNVTRLLQSSKTSMTKNSAMFAHPTVPMTTALVRLSSADVSFRRYDESEVMLISSLLVSIVEFLSPCVTEELHRHSENRNISK